MPFLNNEIIYGILKKFRFTLTKVFQNLKNCGLLDNLHTARRPGLATGLCGLHS